MTKTIVVDYQREFSNFLSFEGNLSKLSDKNSKTL